MPIILWLLGVPLGLVVVLWLLHDASNAKRTTSYWTARARKF